MTRTEIHLKANERRAMVLNLRDTGMSLKAIGEKLGITEARVWQIERKALKIFSAEIAATEDIRAVKTGI